MALEDLEMEDVRGGGRAWCYHTADEAAGGGGGGWSARSEVPPPASTTDTLGSGQATLPEVLQSHNLTISQSHNLTILYTILCTIS